MNRKITLRIVAAVALLAVLCAGGWYGFLQWSRGKVRAEVDAAFASLRERGAVASFADASFDPKEMAITISGISIASQDGSARVSVGRLSASGGERPIDRRVSIEALDLDDLVITLSGEAAAGGTVTYTVPQVMIDRYNGPMTLIAAGEGSGPFGALRVTLRQLAATTAAKVTIPEARGRIAPAGGPVTEVTYTNIAAEGVNAGQIRSLLADSIAFTTSPPARPAPSTPDAAKADPAPGRIEGRVDGLVAAHIDTAPLLAITQPGGPVGKAAEAYGRLYGKIVTGAYKVTQENAFSHGGSALLMENVAIRPAAFDARRLAELNALSLKASDLTAQENAQLATLARDLIAGMSFSVVAITNATSEQAGEKGRVASVRMEGLADGLLDAMVMEGLEGTAPDGGITKLERFGIRQLNFNQLARLSSTADQLTPEAAQVLFRVFAGVEMKGLETPSGDGKDGAEPIKVGTFALSWGGSLGALPSYLDFALTDVSGPIQADDGEPFSYLVEAGITRATVSMALKLFYDINEETLTLGPASAEVKDAFRVNIESSVQQVPGAAFKDPDGFAAALPAMTAGPLKLTLTDLGLAKLAYAQHAADAGVTPEAYREELATLAQAFADQLAQSSPDAAAVGAAVASFLRNPGTLTLTATPRGKVPLLPLLSSDDPSVLLEAFKVEAAATAP